MMGATVRSLAIIGIAAFVSGMFSRWLAKTITLSPHTQRNYPELQKRLNGWLSAALKTARILTVCVAVMLLLSYLGQLDALLQPYVRILTQDEIDVRIKRFWRYLDRTLPDAFMHANIGPSDSP